MDHRPPTLTYLCAMIRIGRKSILKLNRQTDNGWYLIDALENEVLLPNKYCPERAFKGQELEVFIYLDGKERPVATTIEPMVSLYGFGYLEVVSSTRLGAFMDMGLEKHLFVPYKEMHERLQEGEKAVIFMFLDSLTDRLVGSARVTKWLDRENVELNKGQKVRILCFDENEVGFKVVIDQKYQGIVYKNEAFSRLSIGEETEGFVRMIRDGGLVDVSLTLPGRGKMRSTSEELLDRLKAAGGFLPYHDKTPSEQIQTELNMSKKAFKEAVGGLYKSRKVRISETGLHLI